MRDEQRRADAHPHRARRAEVRERHARVALSVRGERAERRVDRLQARRRARGLDAGDVGPRRRHEQREVAARGLAVEAHRQPGIPRADLVVGAQDARHRGAALGVVDDHALPPQRAPALQVVAHGHAQLPPDAVPRAAVDPDHDAPRPARRRQRRHEPRITLRPRRGGQRAERDQRKGEQQAAHEAEPRGTNGPRNPDVRPDVVCVRPRRARTRATASGSAAPQP